MKSFKKIMYGLVVTAALTPQVSPMSAMARQLGQALDEVFYQEQSAFESFARDFSELFAALRLSLSPEALEFYQFGSARMLKEESVCLRRLFLRMKDFAVGKHTGNLNQNELGQLQETIVYGLRERVDWSWGESLDDLWQYWIKEDAIELADRLGGSLNRLIHAKEINRRMKRLAKNIS